MRLVSRLCRLFLESRGLNNSSQKAICYCYKGNLALGNLLTLKLKRAPSSTHTEVLACLPEHSALLSLTSIFINDNSVSTQLFITHRTISLSNQQLLVNITKLNNPTARKTTALHPSHPPSSNFSLLTNNTIPS